MPDTVTSSVAVPTRQAEKPRPAQRALFVRSGTFSHINASVERQLRTKLPGVEFDVLDVRDVLRAHRGYVASRFLFACLQHGFGSVLRRRDPIDTFILSSPGGRLINQAVRSRVSSQGYAFTFQTQSMWDGACPGIPHFLYTDHTELANLTYPSFDRRRLRGPWWTAIERRIYHNATRVFTMSSHVTRSVIEDYGVESQRVECVFAGSNSQIPARGTDARPEEPVILFVGVDWNRKGGDDLVGAFRLLRQTHPKARLRIVGCSPDLKEPNVEVLGRLPLSAMPRLYEEAAVFCLPTRIEPFGIAFVEAMHAGLPIVGPNLGAIPDMVVDGVNGFRFAPGDIADLARALSNVVSQPEQWKTWGDASRTFARRRYTWDAVGERLAAAILRHL